MWLVTLKLLHLTRHTRDLDTCVIRVLPMERYNCAARYAPTHLQHLCGCVCLGVEDHTNEVSTCWDKRDSHSLQHMASVSIWNWWYLLPVELGIKEEIVSEGELYAGSVANGQSTMVCEWREEVKSLSWVACQLLLFTNKETCKVHVHCCIY